jgi:hypothetical protein
VAAGQPTGRQDCLFVFPARLKQQQQQQTDFSDSRRRIKSDFF